MAFGDDEEDNEVSALIDDYSLAEQCFSAKFLFVINELRVQAADLEPVDRLTYQARLAGARLAFDKLSKDKI